MKLNQTPWPDNGFAADFARACRGDCRGELRDKTPDPLDWEPEIGTGWLKASSVVSLPLLGFTCLARVLGGKFKEHREATRAAALGAIQRQESNEPPAPKPAMVADTFELVQRYHKICRFTEMLLGSVVEDFASRVPSGIVVTVHGVFYPARPELTHLPVTPQSHPMRRLASTIVRIVANGAEAPSPLDKWRPSRSAAKRKRPPFCQIDDVLLRRIYAASEEAFESVQTLHISASQTRALADEIERHRADIGELIRALIAEICGVKPEALQRAGDTIVYDDWSVCDAYGDD